MLGAAIPITGAYVAEAGLDYAVTEAVKIGVSYSGQDGRRASTHPSRTVWR